MWHQVSNCDGCAFNYEMKKVSWKFFVRKTHLNRQWIWQWRMNNFSFLSELYFLITKFLANGPLRNASEVRLLWPIMSRIVSNLLNVIKMWNFCAIAGTDERVGTFKGKCFSFMFQCLQIFLFYTNVRYFSWAIFTCFARVLCVHVKLV